MANLTLCLVGFLTVAVNAQRHQHGSHHKGRECPLRQRQAEHGGVRG